MITKEALIAEIERVQPQDMETVFKIIKAFTLSTEDLLKIGNTTLPETTDSAKKKQEMP